MNVKVVAVVGILLVAAAGAGVYVLMAEKNDPGIDLDATDVSLNIFGNADGNYRLDNNDVKTIRNFIDNGSPVDELKKVTDSKGNVRYLADANADGVVDENDIAYLESVMDRTAPKLHFLDGYGNFTSTPMKISRIACEFYSNSEILMLVGAQDKIVAVDNPLIILQDYYLQGVKNKEKLVNFHSMRNPDFDKAAEAEPEVWLTYGNTIEQRSTKTQAVVFGLNLTNVDLVNVYKSGVVSGALLAGYIFDNVEAAEKYVKWAINLWNTLKKGSSSIKEEDRPVVFYTGYGNYVTKGNEAKTLRCFIKGNTLYHAVELAGGRNVVDFFKGELVPSSSVQLDVEWLMDQDFDYVFVHSIKYTGGGGASPHVPIHGYCTNDSSEFLSEHERIAKLKAFEHVGEANVYLTPGDFMNNASGGLLNATIVAKTVNPEVFKDLDIKKVHQEYIDIMGFDFDLDKNGVFLKTY